MVRKQPNSAGT